jgi:hypothetical protein
MGHLPGRSGAVVGDPSNRSSQGGSSLQVLGCVYLLNRNGLTTQTFEGVTGRPGPCLVIGSARDTLGFSRYIVSWDNPDRMRCPHCNNEIQSPPISKAAERAKKWLSWSGLIFVSFGVVALNTHDMLVSFIAVLGLGLVWKFGTDYLEALIG